VKNFTLWFFVCAALCFSGCSDSHLNAKPAEPPPHITEDAALEKEAEMETEVEPSSPFILPISFQDFTIYEEHPLGIGSTDGIFLTSLEDTDPFSFYGTDILATADGTVVEICTEYVPGTGFGKYIVLEHEDGFRSTYGHCSDISVSVGDQVKQGDKIAEAGSTGATDRAGCYFEISKDSVPVSLSQYFGD